MASVFSGKAGRNAAIWQAGQAQTQLGELTGPGGIYNTGYQQAQGRLGPAYGTASDYLSDTYKQSRSDVTAGFGQGRTDLQAGQKGALGALSGGYGQALGSLTAGYDKAIGTGQEAVAGWDPLVQRAMGGYDMYNNAMGLGGAAGTAAAQDAFKVGPGYQFQVDEATQQAQRAANKTGMLFSGNTNDATTRLASNMANKEYGSWLDRLSGYQGAAERATTGRTGALNNVADLQRQQGVGQSALQSDLATKQSGVYTDTAKGLADLSGKQGTALAGLASDYGQNQAAMSVGLGQSLANLDLMNMQNLAGANQNYYGTVIPAGGAGMMAGQQAAGNRMGALMGGLQLGAQALGGAAGGGGGAFGSFLSGMFGGK
jgi:hypothetical protein